MNKTHRTSKRKAPNQEAKTATALQYQPGAEDIAPVIIAQEKGALADQLIILARAKGVEVKEDANLASLLAAAGVGDEIPIEAFLVVAEIFRYLYQENDQTPPTVSGSASKHWKGNKL